jgi:hypothetical protein
VDREGFQKLVAEVRSQRIGKHAASRGFSASVISVENPTYLCSRSRSTRAWF